jgi:hypothetical protein
LDVGTLLPEVPPGGVVVLMCNDALLLGSRKTNVQTAIVLSVTWKLLLLVSNGRSEYGESSGFHHNRPLDG